GEDELVERADHAAAGEQVDAVQRYLDDVELLTAGEHRDELAEELVPGAGLDRQPLGGDALVGVLEAAGQRLHLVGAAGSAKQRALNGPGRGTGGRGGGPRRGPGGGGGPGGGPRGGGRAARPAPP